MPNWCSNIVHIQEYLDYDRVKEFMEWISAQENISTERGVRPKCAPADGKYLFDICDIEDDEGSITFRFLSKWSPAIRTIHAAAKHFGFSFTMDVEEGGDCLYGDMTYDVDSDTLEYRKVPYDVYPDYEDTQNNFYDELDKLLHKQPYTILTL